MENLLKQQGKIVLRVKTIQKPVELLNVSYDPTRELYQEFNKSFASYWKDKTGQDVTIQQSHGGSGKQGRAVIDGLEADVVTLALAYDIDEIAQTRQLLNKDWEKNWLIILHHTHQRLFLVRKGNPKGIKDWDDLTKKVHLLLRQIQKLLEARAGII